jgi:hypothetical protein
MLNEVQLALIKSAFAKSGCCTAVANELKINRKTVKRAIDRGFALERYKRRTKVTVLKRRALLRRLARETAKKGHLMYPKYSSSSRFREALQTKNNETLTGRHVRRELNAAGLKCYTRPCHATRSTGDMNKKAAFARKYRHVDWRRIVFSDETWLTCNERTGKGMWCTTRKNVLPIEKKARWNVPSIMVWATIGYDWKGPLVVFPSKKVEDGERRQFRLDAAAYIRRCLSTVAVKLNDENRLFQQDGARSHAAKTVSAYLVRKGVDFIADWPPYSPEMNAIERVWKELHELVGRRTPRTQDELIAAARSAWEELPQATINAQCKHFRTQVLAFGHGR